MKGPQQSQGLDNQAIAPLVDAHVIRAENRRGATWYELAYDRMIEPVKTNNAEWFQANLSALQRQAALWQDQNRPHSLLFRGETLEDAERWAAAHDEMLLPIERAFLATCQQVRAQIEANRKRRKRLFIMTLLAGVAFFCVVAGIQA